MNALPKTEARILVIDDEAQIHRFLSPALGASGYVVLRAMNGREGLRLAAEEAPDLVLLDLGLPDLDGNTVLGRLRAFSPVPVIVLSAREREADKIAAFDVGADDYVEKPFGVGELLARIRAALRRRAGVREGRPSSCARAPSSLTSPAMRPVSPEPRSPSPKGNSPSSPCSPAMRGACSLTARSFSPSGGRRMSRMSPICG